MVKDPPLYHDQLPRAEELMDAVVPDDVDLMALSLKLVATIRSNDDHGNGEMGSQISAAR